MAAVVEGDALPASLHRDREWGHCEHWQSCGEQGGEGVALSPAHLAVYPTVGRAGMFVAPQAAQHRGATLVWGHNHCCVHSTLPTVLPHHPC